MVKRFLSGVVAFAVVFCLLVGAEAADSKTSFSKDDTWLIYWYICGTDLEESSQASMDINEMKKVQLPSNVKILIFANGAVNWRDPDIVKKGPGIYLYSSQGLDKISSWKADMGKPDTLKEFLKFGEKNFKPDHRAILFWDHGGVNGLCYDFAFDLNSKPNWRGNHLTYDDLKKVFSSVYGRSGNKPFELVGFDLCISGSYEIAKSMSEFSHYMVGSEPSSSGLGWNYTYWLSALAQDPSMDGTKIGQAICDGSMGIYEALSSEGIEIDGAVNAFSVIDLSKMPALSKAYEKYFGEAKHRAASQKGFSGAFAHAISARTTERYSDCYLDLATLAENTKEIMPAESEELLKAIHSAVAYNRPGEYLLAQGLSTYYPYVTMNTPFSKIEFDSFLSQKSTPSSQKSLYKKLLKLDASKLQGTPVTKDANGNIVARLTPEQLENVSTVRCIVVPHLEYGDESVGLEDEGVVLLPSDIDLKTDWKSGTFTENFQGYWPTIDGHKICMQLSVEGPLRDFYEVPILLSGKRYKKDEENGESYLSAIYENKPVSLQVAYNFETKSYEILGVGSGVENGMIRQRAITLEPGDVITPIFIAVLSEDSIDADGGNVRRYTDPQSGRSILYKFTFGESFQYTGNSKIVHIPFDEGEYAYFFQFIAPNGSSAVSWPAVIKIDSNGNVIKSIPTTEELTESAEE